MSRLISSLKSKKKTLPTEEKLEIQCTKCGKRPATDQDGLCNQCRFNDVLTELANKK